MNKFNLQMFANANTQTTGTASLSNEMKTFYDKTLIRTAEPDLVFDQFAQKRPIPKNGGKKIEFRKFSSLPKATTPLDEGVTPDGQSLTVGKVEAEIHQYGGYVTLSDVFETTAIDNVLVEATQVIGSQAGRTLNTVTRDIVMAGTNKMFAPKIGADGTETPVTKREDLDATAIFKPKYVYRAERVLKNVNAPKIDGKYVAIIHPDVASDIMQDDQFIDVTKYRGTMGTFEGEIGTIGNTRFIENSESKIWTGTTNKCPDGLAVYGILFIAKNAYGVSEVDGLGLKTIIKQLGSAGTADPLDQRGTVGWKGAKAAAILVEEYMLRFECVSSVSADASAN